MDLLCINDTYSLEVIMFYAEHGIKYPEKGKYYTFRDKTIHSNGKTGIRVEEIKNPSVPVNILGIEGKIEPTFDENRFREVTETELFLEEKIEEYA